VIPREVHDRSPPAGSKSLLNPAFGGLHAGHRGPDGALSMLTADPLGPLGSPAGEAKRKGDVPSRSSNKRRRRASQPLSLVIGTFWGHRSGLRRGFIAPNGGAPAGPRTEDDPLRPPSGVPALG
jgi:hypothetical protein